VKIGRQIRLLCPWGGT